MKFTIVTPTYNRPDQLTRAVESVLGQTYQNFEMIIVNDSPLYDYAEFENKYKTNQKIIYIKNYDNRGVNFSRNLALRKTKDTLSDYVIFLDDDDWLYSDALEKINSILEKENYEWLVTNRTAGNINLTKVNIIKDKYNYFCDMLMLRNVYGDATHAIKSEIATQFRFCSHVKNGEELYYFSQIPSLFVYKNINTTDSNGYTTDGLTNVLKNKYKENTKNLWKEKLNSKLFFYLILRTLKSLTK